MNLLVANTPVGKKEPPSTRRSAQRMSSPHKFPRTVPVEHFYPEIRNNLEVVPNEFARCSSPEFTPAICMCPSEQQIFMQNNRFLTQNRIRVSSWGEPPAHLLQTLSPFSVQIMDGMVSSFNSFKYDFN